MNLANQPIRSITKEQQTKHRRHKPTAKQRGEVSTAVRKQLKERSQGLCERCKRERAVQAAHLVRRWKIEGRTTVDDITHLCISCHAWADQTSAGREWLRWMHERLRGEVGE